MNTKPTPTPTPTKNAAAQALGRLGGAAGTAKQNAARVRNGKKGGRPGRICTSCGNPVKGGHDNTALDETCGAHGWRWSNGDESEQDLLRDVLRVLSAHNARVSAEGAALLPRIRRALASR